VREGRLEVALLLPWINAPAERETFFLFSRDNTLVGELGPLFLDDGDGDGANAFPAPPAEDTLPFGMLRLERQIPFAP
jgi:hypothetical protein